MLNAYVSVAIRNFLRRPGYTLLNAAGLSAGIAVAAIAALYLHHELRYDSFHRHADRIFRISGKQNDSWFAALSAPYSNYIGEDQISGIDAYTRIRRWPPKYIQQNENKFYERKVFFTDVNSTFFQMFDFKAIEGNPVTAFRQPNSVVLTRSIALQVFGSREAVGQTLMFDTLSLTVTAVIEDIPSHSNFDFKVLIANDEAMERASALFTFCRISEKADRMSIQEKLLAVSVPKEEFSKLQDIRMIPLKDIHFDGGMVYEMKPAGNKVYLVVFFIIGTAMLILSVLNFVNLSVAVYSRRVKEIAIRKIAGAQKRQIAVQFLVESVALALLSLPLILIVVQLIIPWLNAYMSIMLTNVFVWSFTGFAIITGGVLFVGLVAGMYPAIVLPRISSQVAFRNSPVIFGSWNVRTILVSVQITALVMIFTASWIIRQQLQFLNDKELGFDKEGLIKLKGAWMIDSAQYNRIKNRLLQNPAIVSVSNGFAPGDEDYGMTFKAENNDALHNDLITFGTDREYVGTLGLNIVALRNGTSLSDASSLVLVNETFARRLAFDDPIGQCVVLSPGKKHERRKVVDGVFSDFHFFSLHQQMVPMMLTIRGFGSGINENILVKVKTAGMRDSFAFINQVAKEESPDIPLTAEFLDDTLSQLYLKEQQLSFFSQVLLIMTILLSAIGLVGLVSYMIQQKTKEIGIRKVLGATLNDVVVLIGKPFFTPMMLSFAVGSVFSFFALQRWLESFAYRTTAGAAVFLITLGSIALLLFVTVGSHAIRAAHIDPVKAIRSE